MFTGRRIRPNPSTGGPLVYAIGDIHGRYDLLYELLKAITRDLLRVRHRVTPIFIFLGDYIDRGPNSKEVVQTLIEMMAGGDLDIRCLRGNHEQAMLDFIDGVSGAEGWLLYGGLDTLASYGALPRCRQPQIDPNQVRASLSSRLPQSHEMFIRSTQLVTAVGDYLFVHAGLRPNVRLQSQHPHDLLWIRDEFLRSKRMLEQVVVHGHTPELKPHFDARRIGVDTGAYLTGTLTAARLEGAHQSVIQAVAPPREVTRQKRELWATDAETRADDRAR